MAEDEIGIGHALDHRKQFYMSLSNGGEHCFICLDAYEDGAEIVYPGTCLGHFLHYNCRQRVLNANFGCPICRKPYDATKRNDVLVRLTPPIRLDSSSTMIEIPPGITVDEVGNLIGRRVPCCAYPFTDEDYAVFPDPCVTHPVHSTCYIIDRLGDYTETDVKRTIYCPYPQCGIQYHGVDIVCRRVLDIINLDQEEPFADVEGGDFLFDLD